MVWPMLSALSQDTALVDFCSSAGFFRHPVALASPPDQDAQVFIDRFPQLLTRLARI